MVSTDREEPQPYLGPYTNSHYAARAHNEGSRLLGATYNDERHRLRERRDHLVPRYRDMLTGRYRYRELDTLDRVWGYGGASERRRLATDLTSMAPNKPLFQRLLLHHYSVLNPLAIDPNAEDSFVMDDALVYSQPLLMRPQKLIGHYKRLADWQEFTRDIYEVPAATREYYIEQNSLIERYCEIDNFLDHGHIHYDTLQNYETQDDLTPVFEHDNEDADGDKSPQQQKGKRTKAAPLPVDAEGGILAHHYLGFNEKEEHLAVVLAIIVNFAINIILLIGKIVVALLTNSISMVASLVDSVLDFLSTFIIFVANKLALKKNWRIQHLYPVGRLRLEPLGVLIFSVIIVILFFQVGQEAAKRLFWPAPEHKVPATIGKDAMAIMVFTIVCKLGCWVWCALNPNLSVQALAQDAMTDIVFNTVLLLMPAVGHWFDIWWLDPLGAFGLSIYVIVLWSLTAIEHIQKLCGAAADIEDYKTILYLAYRFAEPINKITALKTYHFGEKLVVEIDVVFDIEKYRLNFKDCHDLAELLQYALESLPMVERAFVHIDYMVGNYKGHLH